MTGRVYHTAQYSSIQLTIKIYLSIVNQDLVLSTHPHQNTAKHRAAIVSFVPIGGRVDLIQANSSRREDLRFQKHKETEGKRMIRIRGNCDDDDGMFAGALGSQQRLQLPVR